MDDEDDGGRGGDETRRDETPVVDSENEEVQKCFMPLVEILNLFDIVTLLGTKDTHLCISQLCPRNEESTIKVSPSLHGCPLLWFNVNISLRRYLVCMMTRIATYQPSPARLWAREEWCLLKNFSNPT